MAKDNWEIYKKLIQTPGTSGFEHEVRKAMRSYITPLAEEVIQDRLGGIFGIKKGDPKGPKVLVAGHMDEVGFMITKITKEGFLKFQTVGGWWSQVMLSQRVEVVARSGKRIPGVIGSTPPHLLDPEQRKKPVDIAKMFIDIGADSDETVKSWGVRLGDFAVPYCDFVEMEGGKRLLGKAWDDRFGCGLAVELLQHFQNEEHPNILYAGATVQEEVGLRGAGTAANMIEPDVFFTADVGPAGDTPGMKDGFGELGKGVVIRIYDRSMIPLPAMRDFLLDTAESMNIPYQFFVSQGGTDAGRVHQTGIGVPSAAIGICGRYIHSNVTVVDKEDIKAAKAFAIALVKNLDQSTYETIIS